MRHLGFTLLELMTTLAVAAVIVAIGVPAFADMVRSNRVITQTNELVGALNLARSEALKRGRRVRVEVKQTGSGWSATVTVQGGDLVRDIDQAAGRVTINEATVDFEPTGAPDGSETFMLQPHASCSGTQRRRVAVTMSGQIITTSLPCA